MTEEGFFKKLFKSHRHEPSAVPESSHPEPETTPPVNDTAITPDPPAPVTDSVSRVYAQALLELAQSANQLDAIAQEVSDLAALLAGNNDLRQLLDSRAIGAEARRGVIERVFKGKVSDTLYRFLQVVNTKDRLGVLPGILASFGEKLDEARGIVKVDAYVAKSLDAGQADRVAKAVGDSLGGKRVVLRQHVNPDLIGGLKLRIGDELIDASVATQLKLMQRRLVEAGQERARELAAIEG